MLAAAAAQGEAKAARDVALLHRLHDMGLRRGEHVQFDLADADMEASQLMVLGKARTQREPLTIPAPTRVALAAWITVWGDGPGLLFISFDRSRKGSGRLTGDVVWRIVGAPGAAVGVKVGRTGCATSRSPPRSMRGSICARCSGSRATRTCACSPSTTTAARIWAAKSHLWWHHWYEQEILQCVYFLQRMLNKRC